MKNIKFIDIIILIAVAIALAVGFVTYKHLRETASKQIESTSKIKFEVFLRGVTITGKTDLIKKGDKTFISIRNVPYTDLEVLDVKSEPKKISLANPSKPSTAIIVDDASQANMYDMTVTVTDTAKITKDGAVVGGNKVKVGLPITLEGKDYKFNGTVTSVEILSDSEKDAK